MKQKKYGLALGGGAFRGFIHIGVLKYLEEKKIYIDELSGTSMGAIIASLYAIGKNSNEIYLIMKNLSFKSLFDFDLGYGLIKGKKIFAEFKRIFGNSKIEDSIVPLSILATNIETGELMIFKKGKIIDALRASISLPGIFIPYKIGKNYYIDGGVINNLPIDILKGKNLIGVSGLKNDFGPLKLKKMIFGFEVNTGFLEYNYQILHRTVLLMMKQNELKSIKNSNKKVIIIKPDFGKLDFYNYDKIDEFIKIGYDDTKKVLKNKIFNTFN